MDCIDHPGRPLCVCRPFQPWWVSIGKADDKAWVMSFVLAGYSTEKVGQALNDEDSGPFAKRHH